MSALIGERESALAERLDQMQGLDEWHLFQNFVLGLLPHESYKDVRHSVVRNDYGRDAVALTPDGKHCFVAVSFDGSLNKIRSDAERWHEDPNREKATVVVFITWTALTEMRISPWRKKIKEDFRLELRVIHRETILAVGAREGVWAETRSRLAIPGHRAGYVRIAPYNGEVVRRALPARPRRNGCQSGSNSMHGGSFRGP